MRKFSDSVVLQFDTVSTGNAGAGKSVTVYFTGTKDKAVLFKDDQITTSSNPVFTDSEGNYSFSVNDGVYDIVVDEGSLSETKVTKVQIAEIIAKPDENTFTIIPVIVTENQSVITMASDFENVVLIIQGVTQIAKTDDYAKGDYVVDKAARTLTMVAPFTFKGNEKVQVWVNDMFLTGATSSVGKISNYLNAQKTNFGEAFTNCCLDNDVVDLEGLTLSTDDSITITELSKVNTIWFNGADITIKSSNVEYQGYFPEHVGPGSFKGGSPLYQVAVETGVDTKIIELTSVDGLKIGDAVNSSLDVFYLPNSATRVGYIAEGGYNKITAINESTKEITLTYNFLRTGDYTVSSGLLKNSWVGINTTFDSGGIRSTSAEHQHLKFTNIKFSNWAGYVASRIDPDVSIYDTGSSITLTGCDIQEQFLDVFLFRGRDITLDSTHCGRVYDFAKQFFAYSQNPNGATVIRNGCTLARMNGDNEFYNSGLGIDSQSYFGTFTLDGSNHFDGTQPADLPTSDFTLPPTGQLYFGIGVPIHDCYHFSAPSGGGTPLSGGGFHSNGDTWVGYIRSIFGTTYVAQSSFSYGSCTFTGSKTSCDPIFINVAGMGSDELLQNYKATLDGGTYYSKAVAFCRGVMVTAVNVDLILTNEDRTSPQVNGSTTLNNINMIGGTIDGRYKIDSNYSTFRDVHIAYKGTSDPSNVVLFSIDTLDSSSNFILDCPKDFEGTGSVIDDWSADLPIVAWFGSNSSGYAPTPNLNFRVDGRSNSYVYGNNFTKQYIQTIKAPKSTAPPSSTKGKFSAKLEVGDKIEGMADGITLNVDQNSAPCLTTNAALKGTTSVITVSISPAFSPTHIAIYNTTFSSWFYYTVASNSAETITVNEDIVSDFSIGDSAYLILATPGSSGGGGIELLSTKVRRNVDLPIPEGVSTNVTYEETDWQEMPGSFAGSGSDRITVTAGVTRVDVASCVRFLSTGVASGTQIQHRIIHYNQAGTEIDIVASDQGNIGYTQHATSTDMLDVGVTAGDYFLVKVLTNNSGGISINRATFSMRKVK